MVEIINRPAGYMEQSGANVIDGNTGIDSAHKSRTIVKMRIINIECIRRSKKKTCKMLAANI